MGRHHRHPRYSSLADATRPSNYPNFPMTSTPISLHAGADHATMSASRSRCGRASCETASCHCCVADPAAVGRRAQMDAMGYLVVAPGVIGWLWGMWCGRWAGRCLKRRADHRGLWMAAFSPKDRPRIDALLTAICDAFLIPPRYRFRIRPSDDIHQFYRRNVRGSLADSLEYENLAMGLERDCNIAPDVVDELLSARPCAVGTLARVIAKPIRTYAVRTVADPTQEE